MFCKHCGVQIEDNIVECPNCGKSLAEDVLSEENIKTQTTDNTITKNPIISNKILICGFIVGLVVLLAVLVMVQDSKCAASTCDNSVDEKGEYCIIHRCNYDGCDSGRRSDSNYCYTHDKMMAQVLVNYLKQNSVSSSELQISNVNLYTKKNSNYTHVEGVIKNNSNMRVSFVEIKGAFKNSLGKVVDTDWTYAVGSEGLNPGESCKWQMSVKKDSTIKDCQVSIIDFNY